MAAWPSYVAEWSEEQDAVFSFVHEAVVPYLSGSIRLRNVAGDFAPFPDGDPPSEVPVRSSEPVSLEHLNSSVEFDNLVYRRAQGLWYAMRDGETLLAQLTAVLESIEQNLGE